MKKSEGAILGAEVAIGSSRYLLSLAARLRLTCVEGQVGRVDPQKNHMHNAYCQLNGSCRHCLEYSANPKDRMTHRICMSVDTMNFCERSSVGSGLSS